MSGASFPPHGPSTDGFELAGLVAVVTGGASGIGLATVGELLARGARVAVLDLAPTGLPAGVRGYAADLADRAAVRAAIVAAATDMGGIDILVNNAGIGAVGTIADNDDVEWARVLSVNVTGIARVTSAALPFLRESAHAAIVNISSIAARNGIPGRALYSASKGAVLSLTLAMATDHLPDGIRVNAVCPGTADTPWIDRLLTHAAEPAQERAALRARQPIGRLVTPEEIACAVVHLASPRNASTTGAVLDVDGGVTSLRTRPHA